MWLHGSLGREAATGRGTVFAIRELLRAQGAGGIAGKTFVIQARLAIAALDAIMPVLANIWPPALFCFLEQQLAHLPWASPSTGLWWAAGPPVYGSLTPRTPSLLSLSPSTGLRQRGQLGSPHPA